MTAALIAALALCLLAVAYPYSLYPLILRLFREKPVKRGPVGPVAPSATLLFCAYNEADSLVAKIDNIRSLKARYPTLEVLAFDDGSSDATPALLDAARDVLTPVHGPGRAGKARGMKTLVAQASGDLLVFTDANVLLDPDAIDNLLAYYADPDVGGVLGSLRYDGVEASSSAQVGGLYWRLEEALKDAESRTGNVMGADGSIFSVRRALYPDFPDHVLDDLTVSMAVVFAGKRLIKAKDVVAREVMVARREDEMRRKVRIAARSWSTHHYLRPSLRRMGPLDRFKYASRKMIRWFGGLWIALGALAALGIAWHVHSVFALLWILLCGCMLAFGLVKRTGPLAALVDVLLAYGASLRGILLAMRGADFTLWQPAKSRTDRTGMGKTPET